MSYFFECTGSTTTLLLSAILKDLMIEWLIDWLTSPKKNPRKLQKIKENVFYFIYLFLDLNDSLTQFISWNFQTACQMFYHYNERGRFGCRGIPLCQHTPISCCMMIQLQSGTSGNSKRRKDGVDRDEWEGVSTGGPAQKSGQPQD